MLSAHKTTNLIFLLVFTFYHGISQATESSSILIKNIRIVSPNSLNVSKPQNVLIVDDRISKIGAEEFNAKTVINGVSKYLIPGLIDSHVHLGSTGGMREDQAEQFPQLLNRFRIQEPKSYLYFGYTTVVDLKQSETFAENWEQHEWKPDLIYCKSAPFTNGYGMAFVPEKMRFQNPYFIYDKSQQSVIPKSVNPKEHTPTRIIAKIKETNASCIKTYHESGFGGLWDWPTPSNEIISKIGNLAKKNNLIHFHHGNSLESHRQAAEVGVNVMAHGLWHWEELNSNALLPNSIKVVLDKIIDNGTYYQPTSQVIGGELALLNPEFLDEPNLRHSLPLDLLNWHKEGNSNWFQQKLEKNIRDNPDVVERFLGKQPTGKPGETSSIAMKRLGLVVNYLSEHGAKLVLASDTPASPTYTNPPGLNGLLEIKNMQKMGLSQREIFQMATINNAKMLGLEHEIGDVKQNMKANLLLLNSNPLDSNYAFDDIDTVIIGGKVIKRKSLSAMSN